MITRGFSSAAHPKVSFKTLPYSFFLELETTLQDDKSPDKKDAIKAVLPKIRQEIHQVSERHAYKLLYPLANLETHN